MDRRQFFAASSLTAGAAVLPTALAGAAAVPGREFYEMRLYRVAGEAQQKALVAFLRDAALPAMNRIGINPVGVFTPLEDASDLTVYVLMPHQTLDSVATATARMLADEAFRRDGRAFLEVPSAKKGYERIESSLLLAFEGVPKLEVPPRRPERVFQLRCYESHSVLAGQKKIDMFNKGGETAIFRKTGLSPVFFGEMLIGKNLPNLTYMLSFPDQNALRVGWQKFVTDPEWDVLKADPQYADTVSKIHNIVLRPLACSQI